MLEAKNALSLEEWYAEIARKSGVAVNVVKQVHSEYGVEPQSAIPERKAIRFQRIKFSGTKTGTEDDGPFAFEWEGLRAGLFGVFSEEVNLVGKSTILNLLYSVLRGNFEKVSPVTMHWIDQVEAAFSIGASDYKLHVESLSDPLSGQAILSRDGGDNTNVVFQGPLSDLSEFMDQLFMRELSFDKMYTTLKKEKLVPHGWPAMASALFVSSSEGAIVGDHIAGYSQRLLQTFIGLPWVSTQSRASAMHKILLKKSSDKKANSSENSSSKALEELNRQLGELPERTELERQARLDEDEMKTLTKDAVHLQSDLNSTGLSISRKKAELEMLRSEWVKLKRLLQAKIEEQNAGLIFRKLEPVCCPSCESTSFREVAEMAQPGDSCPLCKDS